MVYFEVAFAAAVVDAVGNGMVEIAAVFEVGMSLVGVRQEQVIALSRTTVSEGVVSFPHPHLSLLPYRPRQKLPSPPTLLHLHSNPAVDPSKPSLHPLTLHFLLPNAVVDYATIPNQHNFQAYLKIILRDLVQYCAAKSRTDFPRFSLVSLQSD